MILSMKATWKQVSCERYTLQKLTLQTKRVHEVKALNYELLWEENMRSFSYSDILYFLFHKVVFESLENTQMRYWRHFHIYNDFYETVKKISWSSLKEVLKEYTISGVVAKHDFKPILICWGHPKMEFVFSSNYF